MLRKFNATSSGKQQSCGEEVWAMEFHVDASAKRGKSLTKQQAMGMHCSTHRIKSSSAALSLLFPRAGFGFVLASFIQIGDPLHEFFIRRSQTSYQDSSKVSDGRSSGHASARKDTKFSIQNEIKSTVHQGLHLTGCSDLENTKSPRGLTLFEPRTLQQMC